MPFRFQTSFWKIKSALLKNKVSLFFHRIKQLYWPWVTHAGADWTWWRTVTPRSSWLPSALSLGHHSTNRCRGWLRGHIRACPHTHWRKTDSKYMYVRFWINSPTGTRETLRSRRCSPLLFGASETNQDTVGSWAGKPLCVPHFWFVGNRFQPPLLSRVPKGRFIQSLTRGQRGCRDKGGAAKKQ